MLDMLQLSENIRSPFIDGYFDFKQTPGHLTVHGPTWQQQKKL